MSLKFVYPLKKAEYQIYFSEKITEFRPGNQREGCCNGLSKRRPRPDFLGVAIGLSDGVAEEGTNVTEERKVERE